MVEEFPSIGKSAFESGYFHFGVSVFFHFFRRRGFQNSECVARGRYTYIKKKSCSYV